MNKTCVICSIPFEVNSKNRNKKYCDICRIIVWKKQKKRNDQSRYRTTRIECDLFCIKCFSSLPIGSHNDRKYCASCLSKHQISLNTKKRRNGILNEFYHNLKINLIQSPYLIEIKTLNKIILCENK